ncbi:hypothetical protein [Nonomuraea dietziae]|uniref:hypothetical protein n=1 Tax=Nonomuraea dietziae TaxID=65515 RepID=UPI0031D1D031
MCVEVEDEWFAIARYRGDEEPRVFLSDAQAGVNGQLGELFAEFAGVAPDKESTTSAYGPPATSSCCRTSASARRNCSS